MAVENNEITKIFDEVADLLEITGASYFRVRAYRNASRVIRDLSTPLYRIAKDPDEKLEDLPGIGKDLAGKIQQIIETGDLDLRLELEGQLPTGLFEVMKVAGIGPRKAHTLFLELGVSDLESLGEAARSGKIKELKGFGPKTESNILENIFALKGLGKRMLWADAEACATRVVEHMKGLRGLERIEVTGSFRRLMETVGDLDILVTCEDPAAAMDRFVTFGEVSRVIAKGPTKSSVVIGEDLQCDIRVVEEDSFGAALQYFTGSKAHGVALRGMALRKGLKLNEYGVFRGDERIAGLTEEEVYGSLGLPWIPPELRENRGEIRLALEGRLPRLVALEDIKGDLHVHTSATDGLDTLEAVVGVALRKGYSYLAITDHTPPGTHGLDARRLVEQWQAIAALDERTPGIHILRGVEVDILDDGSLEMADDVLSQADYVVASVHDSVDMPRPRMTRRIVKAMSHPLVDALGHPTGRKINKKPPYQVNMEDVIAAASRYDTWLELNAAPDRLDIDDLDCAAARQHGVGVTVASDTHRATALDFMRYGLNQARRGGLEPQDVPNTLNYRSLRKALRRKVRVRAPSSGALRGGPQIPSRSQE
jgi:DNA polymerase (family 10)